LVTPSSKALNVEAFVTEHFQIIADVDESLNNMPLRDQLYFLIELFVFAFNKTSTKDKLKFTFLPKETAVEVVINAQEQLFDANSTHIDNDNFELTRTRKEPTKRKPTPTSVKKIEKPRYHPKMITFDHKYREFLSQLLKSFLEDERLGAYAQEDAGYLDIDPYEVALLGTNDVEVMLMIMEQTLPE
jgi:hypothetical protein